MQKLQMVTQEGKNVAVCAIRGNFDDAQTGVKQIFTDPGWPPETGGPGNDVLQRQFHQLGPAGAAGSVLYFRLQRSAVLRTRLRARATGLPYRRAHR